MFSSVSSCTPNSAASTSYRATTAHQLDIWANVTVSVDGTVQASRPISVNANSLVTATVTTSANYLAYKFIPYSIDGLTSTYAVVNKNLYQPNIKVVDSELRWFNYPETLITVTRLAENRDVNASTGMNRDIIDVDSLHVVLDHWNETVYFYDPYGFRAEVGLPAGPIDYRKINYQTVGTYTQDLLVLCNNGRMYRIRFDNRLYPSSEFKPKVVNPVDLDNLPYTEDIPTVGTFENLARKRRRARLFPVVKALDTDGNTIILAGSDSVYYTDLNFNILFTFTLANEEIMHVASVGSGYILITTRSHKVYSMFINGATALLYSSTAIGYPYRIPGTSLVAIPEGNQQRVLIFNNSALVSTWSTPDFVPAYARAFADHVWVTGHDTNEVYRFTTAGTATKFQFRRRVTLVSVQDNDVIGIHALQNFNTLNTPGIYKLIPFALEPRTGPINNIGTRPVQPLLLGDAITPVPGPGITAWTNGIINGVVNNQDNFSVSYSATQKGTFTSTVILGETAVDYTVTVVTSSSMRDYHNTGVTALNRLTPVFGIIDPPDIGDYNQGTTIFDNLGFTINMWGNVYSNVNLSTNGYMTFDADTTRTAGHAYGDLAADVIYIEPGDLLQDYPIDNTDPLNLRPGRLDSAEVPGITFKPQLLGEYRGLRIRWVGTAMKHYPFGNIVNTVTTIVNHAEIPVPDIRAANALDYVSGTGIVSSLQVTGTYAYTNTVTAYRSQANVIYTTTAVSPPKYANILVAASRIGSVQSNSSTVLAGNTVVNQSGSVVTVDGITPAEVDTGWLFAFGTVRSTQATSLLRTSYTVTSVDAVTSSALIRLGLVDYNKIFVNQAITGANVIPSTVTAKNIVNKVFTVSANVTSVIEGNAVEFAFTTVNVSAGTTFNYQLTGTGLTANDLVSGATTGTFTVGGSSTRVFVTNADIDIEGSETVTFTVSNVYPGLGNMSVNIDILDTGTASSAPKTTTASVSEYMITVSTAQTLAANDTIDLAKTDISFTSIAPVSGLANYELHQVQADVNVPVITVATPVTLEGLFVQVNSAVSISANTSVRFKANVPAPTYAYEIGLYAGRNYQFIELYWDQPTHSATANVGPAAASISKINSRVPATSAHNNSVVWGSEAADGIWYLLGSGSFTHVNSGYNPRTPRYFIEDNRDATALRYNVYVDQLFPAFANVRYSLDYGHLYRNGGFYTGTENAQTNDRLTVVVPFKSTLRPSVSILGIGDHQVPLPTAPYAVANTIPSNTTLLDNYARETRANTTITIGTTGLYMLPKYYRSSYSDTGLEYRFEANQSGTVSNITVGNYYNFSAGDTVTVYNQISSTRKYDTRDIILAGPRTYVSRLRTAGDAVFNNMNFANLVLPYVRYQDEYAPGLPVYRTANITAVGTTSAELFVSGVGTELVVNGNVATDTAVVTAGSTVALQWLVPNYFETSAIVYQIAADLIDAGNVYMPIGSWNIEPRTITAPTEPVQTNTISIIPTTELDTITEIRNTIVGDLLEPGTRLVQSLGSQWQDSRTSYIINGQLSSEYVRALTYILANTSVATTSLPPTYTVTSMTHSVLSPATAVSAAITANDLPADGTWFLVNQITVERDAYTYTLFTDTIPFDSNRIQPTEFVSNQITAEYFTPNGHHFTSNITNNIMVVQTGQFIWQAATGQLDLPIVIIATAMPDAVVQTLDTEILVTKYLPTRFQSAASFDGTNTVNTVKYDQFSSFNTEQFVSQAQGVIESIREHPIPIQYSEITDSILEQLMALDSESTFDITAGYVSGDTEILAQQGQEFVTNDLITDSIGPDFEDAVSSFEYSIGPDFEDAVSGFEYSMVQDFVQYNQFTLDTEFEMVYETQLELAISAEYLTETLISQQFGMQYYYPNLLEFDINPEFYTPSMIMPSMLPVVVQEHLILQGYNIVLSRPIERFVAMDFYKQDHNPVNVKIDFELYQDSLFENLDLVSQQATSTDIAMYADDGRGGNKVLYPSRLPFVFYQRSYNYGYGAFTTQTDAATVAAKYVSAQAIQIVGTNYWNYRIHFDTTVLCTARGGLRFPVSWLIRGG